MKTGKSGASGDDLPMQVLASGEAMSAEEYRAAVETLQLSQQRFAKKVGASARTGQKWALGETRIPGSVALLLRLLLARPELVTLIEGSSPIPPRARTPSKRKTKHGQR